MQERAPAERLTSVVRVHADRVHDAARRLGASPEEAVDVVLDSALSLVGAVAQDPGLPDPVGWWFARARALVPRHGADVDVPLGGGVLSADADQALLGSALEALPEDQRTALLLRDSYDLPAESVGTALGRSADDAMALVGRARLAFLPHVDPEPGPVPVGHDTDPAALARLAEGGQVAARDATVRRHAQACSTCRAVVEAQDYAHRLLSGLVVVALPDAARDPLLARVEAAAARALPAPVVTAVEVDEDELEDDEPRRLVTPLGVLLGLVLALALGVGIGLLASRNPGGIDPAVAGRGVALVTAPPLPVVPPPAPEQVARAKTPPTAETRVFTLPVRTTPPPPPPVPTAAPTTEAPVDQLALTLDPSSGPNGQTISVSGTGWTPGSTVTVEYRDTVGAATGSSATAVADERGRFTVGLAAQDPQNLPGPHEVFATNGTQSAGAQYEAQA